MLGDMDRIERKIAPKIHAEILRLVQEAKDQTVVARVERALKNGDLVGAIKAIPLEELKDKLEPGLGELLRSSLEEGAKIAPLPGGATMAFNVTNQEAVEYLRRATLNTALNIQRESELAIRLLMQRSFMKGIPPSLIAKDIVEVIGLTGRQVLTVENYRAYLEKLAERGLKNLSEEAKQKLLRGGMRGFKNMNGLTSERINALTEVYRQRLLAEQSMTIARTLTIDASNQGQKLLWKQAADKGLLNESEWEVAWIVTRDDRLCPFCMAMDGKQRSMSGLYSNGVGRPTLHPNCRCTEGLIRKRGGLKLTSRLAA